MFFLNLSAAEFFTLLGVLGGFTAALYLLDRTKRTRVVSTLRFWTSAVTFTERKRRRRMREPWSLALQLVCLTLLLLAIAQLEVGARHNGARNHVLLLDTSAWTAQHSGPVTLFAREKQAAEQYVAALPPLDRVMVVRADALATPATAFTADRKQIARAVAASKPGFSALNMALALVFARQAQNWSPGEPGEVVYIGPGMIAADETAPPDMKNLRTILVRPEREHVGIRGMSVRRSETDPNAWRAAVMVKNYGLRRAAIRLQLQCAGTAFAARTLSLNGGEESAAEYDFVTHAAGELIADIRPGDTLTSDQHVALELPRASMLRVAAVTNRPEVLEPLFAANDRLKVRVFPTLDREAENWADLIVFDRIAPVTTKHASIWIHPPVGESPLPVKGRVSNTAITNWNPVTPLSAGLHTKDMHIANGEVFHTFDGDVTVASSAEGPMIVARNADSTHGKVALLGFDPLAGELRFQVTTPLLFANLLRWISPDVFRPAEAIARQVGVVMLKLDENEDADAIRVLDNQGGSVPFFARKQSLQGSSIQIFARHPEVLHVLSEEREQVLSIAVPDVAASEWNPPANAQSGLPAIHRVAPTALGVWKWLALFAALGLGAEWTLFGHDRVRLRPAKPAHAVTAFERERELVAK